MSLAAAITVTTDVIVPLPRKNSFGPLGFLSAVLQRTPMNASLRYEALQTIETIREALEVREQHGLEYVFARALVETCLAATPGGDGAYNVLVNRFRNFDRRRQELSVVTTDFPLAGRDARLRHFVNVPLSRSSMFRAIHLAAAVDCDGPGAKSEEKQAIFVMLCRVLAGGGPE